MIVTLSRLLTFFPYFSCTSLPRLSFVCQLYKHSSVYYLLTVIYISITHSGFILERVRMCELLRILVNEGATYFAHNQCCVPKYFFSLNIFFLHKETKINFSVDISNVFGHCAPLHTKSPRRFRRQIPSIKDVRS